MTLLRNLLFLLLVAGGGLRLGKALFPLTADPARRTLPAPAPRPDDFADTLAKVNESFRQSWAERGLTPAPPAPDLLVARRLALALAGTVPSLEEVRRFEASDPATRADAYADFLLRDRRFGDYWAARTARSVVGGEEGPLIVYRKRRFTAWLSDRLMANAPHGDTARRMIAGTGLNTDNPAVNFVCAAVEDADGEQRIDAEKLTVRLCRAFLGLRLDCAQCHDHFLEPSWRQTDFQSLAAFFGQAKQIVTVVTDDPSREYRYDDRKGGAVAVDPAVPFLPELLPAEGTRRERLASWVTHRDNRHFARAAVNRAWATMLGRPLLARVEAETLDEAGPPALDLLADDFAAHGHDLHRLIRLIAATEVFRLDSEAPFDLSGEHEAAWAAFPLTRLRPEQVVGAVLQAASVRTIDRDSHVLVRLARQFGERDFVERYGDGDEEETGARAATVPQRLLMMNGEVVSESAKDDLVHAAGRVALMAPTDAAAVECAYLGVLSRRPTPAELAHFTARLADRGNDERGAAVSDLYWALFNSTELSWNH